VTIGAAVQAVLVGMPAPRDLHRSEVDGQVFVAVGATVLFSYAADDAGLRNLAAVTLPEMGFTGRRVAQVLGITEEYVSMLRAPELLTWRVRSWGVGLAFDAVADGQVGVGVAGSGLGELLAEGVEGAAAAGCGGGVEPDVQGVPGDVQVAGEGERLPERGAGFVVGPAVVRAQHPGEGGLGVVGGHRRLRG
jgi:hypothetical protein